jgi:SHS2 domain-containing protein
LEHVADLGLHVWAPSLEELIEEAAVALVGLMGTASGPAATEKITVSSGDLASLLVDWLSEVLFLFEARGLVPRRVEAEIDRSSWSLVARIDGVRAESIEQTGPAVKAVTYHRLEASETDVRVYLDV